MAASRSAPTAAIRRRRTAARRPRPASARRRRATRSAGRRGPDHGVALSGRPRARRCGRPSSPFGRTTSTAAITRNTSTSVACGTSTMPKACSTPISSAGEIGARQAAEAADHDHHEGLDDDGQVHLQIGRLVGQRQRAAKPGEAGAEREHRGEQHALIDAERGRPSRGPASRRAPACPSACGAAAATSAASTSGPIAIRTRS